MCNGDFRVAHSCCFQSRRLPLIVIPQLRICRMTTKQYGNFVFLSVLLLCFQAIPTSAEIYKYIDDNGIIHYTDNLTTIPSEYRSQLEQQVKKTAPAPAPAIETRTSLEKRLPPRDTNESKLEVSGLDRHATALSESGPSADMALPPDSKQSSIGSDKLPITETEKPIKENIETSGTSDSDHAPSLTNPPSDAPSEVSQPDVIKPATEQVKAISGEEVKSERIRQLGEQKNTLEEKVKQLDQQYRTVLEERKRLEDHRKSLTSKAEIETYNQQVQQLNDKIQEYRSRRQTLEFEVRTFNDSIIR